MSNDDLKILRPKEMCELLSISKQTLYRWAREGKLPPKVRMGPASVGWRRSDIEEWIEKKTERNE